MVDSSEIRGRLDDPNLSATTLADLENVSAVLRNLAEADKARIDALDAQRKSEVLRFWVPVLAPTVTAIALVATLAIQMYQIRLNAVAQESVAEDTAWREATKNLTAMTGPGIPIGLHQLRPFLHSSRYGRTSRELLITLIADLKAEGFEIVLPDILHETTWANFSDLARLERGLDGEWVQATKDKETAQAVLDTVTKEPENAPAHAARLQNAQRQLASANDRSDGVYYNIGVTAKGIVDFMRANSSSRPEGHIDLKYADFVDADLTKIELTNIDLSFGTLRHVDMSGACVCSAITTDTEFSPSSFDRSVWTNTAWWRAGSVSPELLTYLEKTYPFSAKALYAGDAATTQEYRSALQRLHAKNDAVKAQPNATTNTPAV